MWIYTSLIYFLEYWSKTSPLFHLIKCMLDSYQYSCVFLKHCMVLSGGWMYSIRQTSATWDSSTGRCMSLIYAAFRAHGSEMTVRSKMCPWISNLVSASVPISWSSLHSKLPLRVLLSDGLMALHWITLFQFSCLREGKAKECNQIAEGQAA